MNRIVKFVAAVALTCAATVQASEQNAPVKVDAAKGEALFNAGAADRGVPACASCHGAAG